MAARTSSIREMFAFVSDLCETPSIYSRSQAKDWLPYRSVTKDIYDSIKNAERSGDQYDEALPELIVDNFDEEQIWQELELQNMPFSSRYLQNISQVLATRSVVASNETVDVPIKIRGEADLGPLKMQDEEAEEEGQVSDVNDDDLGVVNDQEVEDDESTSSEDDFDGDDLGAKDSDSDESGLPCSDSEGSGEDNEDIKKEKHVMYNDFFDAPPVEREVNAEEIDGILDGKLDRKKETQLSTFESRQERMKKRIEELEENNLSQKPWQLLGEASACVRPEDSLLQEHLQFEHTKRPAPVITEEITLSVEDLIRQRITDGAFDDVVRKVKPKLEPYEYKKRLELDQEKSKVSLTEIYEEEYKRRQETEKKMEDEELPQHKEIKKMMGALFAKLDALSSYHFTPKPPAPELTIVNNMPSICVEEVAPLVASSANLLAPEEILERPQREIKSKGEKTKSDMKRERRAKKSRQKQKARRNMKLETSSGSDATRPVKKRKKTENVNGVDKTLKSSGRFFSKLAETMAAAK